MAMKFSRFKVGRISFNLIYKTGQLDLYTKSYEFLKLALKSGTFSGPMCIKWWLWIKFCVIDHGRYFSLKIGFLMVIYPLESLQLDNCTIRYEFLKLVDKFCQIYLLCENESRSVINKPLQSALIFSQVARRKEREKEEEVSWKMLTKSQSQRSLDFN